jgi:hypothetical protein
MRTYRQDPILAEQHVVWMVALFTAMTLLLSLFVVRPAQ